MSEAELIDMERRMRELEDYIDAITAPRNMLEARQSPYERKERALEFLEEIREDHRRLIAFVRGSESGNRSSVPVWNIEGTAMGERFKEHLRRRRNELS